MDRLEVEILKLEQGTRFVRDYEHEFNRLMNFFGGDFREQRFIKKFMNELGVEIRSHCQVRDFRNLIDPVDKAVVIETRIEEEAKLAKAVLGKDTKVAEVPKQEQVNRGVSQRGTLRPYYGKCNKQNSRICIAASHLCFRCRQPKYIRHDFPLGKVTCF